MRVFRRARGWLVLPLVLAACDHAAPGRVAGPEDVGPFQAGLPRRLTFSTLEDRTPSVTGSLIAFTRTGTAYANPTYNTVPREECIAVLPVEGGTLRRTLCPHDLIVPADTFVHTWYEPALSPDGRRVAFVWQRGPNVGPLGFWQADLVVASLDRVVDPAQVRGVVNYEEQGVIYPRWANVATHITWVGEGRLRFLATFQRIFKTKGGGAERVTDTTYEPLALMEMDATTGAMSVVPGSDSVVNYTGAPGGGLWVVREGDRSLMLHLDPATGTRTEVARFSSEVVDLITLEDAAVAVVSPVVDPAFLFNGIPRRVVRGGDAIELFHPPTGARMMMTGFANPVRRLAPTDGWRFVAEIEQASGAFGASADLWLLAFP